MSEGCHRCLMVWFCNRVSRRSSFDPEIDTLGGMYVSASAHSRKERKEAGFLLGQRQENVPTGLCALPMTPPTVKAVYDRSSLQSRTWRLTKHFHRLLPLHLITIMCGPGYQPWVRREKLQLRGWSDLLTAQSQRYKGGRVTIPLQLVASSLALSPSPQRDSTPVRFLEIGVHSLRLARRQWILS